MNDKERRILMALYAHGGWGTVKEIRWWMGYNDGRKVAQTLYVLMQRGLVTDNRSHFRGIDQNILKNYDLTIFDTKEHHVYALTSEGSNLAKDFRNVYHGLR
jgi:uncharacterized protein YpuA (DUF1002 family)